MVCVSASALNHDVCVFSANYRHVIASGQFAKIPFVTATNLDEGSRLTSFFIPCCSHALVYTSGASSTSQGVLNTTADVVEPLDVIDQPFTTTPSAAFQGDIEELLDLYPDNPALGSPFGTGNNTFGAGAEYKRAAAIVDDVAFQAPRRAWIQAEIGRAHV